MCHSPLSSHRLHIVLLRYPSEEIPANWLYTPWHVLRKVAKETPEGNINCTFEVSSSTSTDDFQLRK